MGIGVEHELKLPCSNQMLLNRGDRRVFVASKNIWDGTFPLAKTDSKPNLITLKASGTVHMLTSPLICKTKYHGLQEDKAYVAK